MLKLFVGNKNYSSWSMRPWVMLKEAGIAFDEVMLKFDEMGPDSAFKQAIGAITPSARVPVLVDEGLVVWDTLAIAEYLAETFPQKKLWPADKAARARARSVCAEMHSGFGALRSHFGMNIEAAMPDIGAVVLRDQPAARADLARIVAMWSELLAQHGGPMLFGEFSIADAYFAPVCMRIRTYALPVPPVVSAYVERVAQLESVQAWIKDALAEHDFVVFDEPYRFKR